MMKDKYRFHRPSSVKRGYSSTLSAVQTAHNVYLLISHEKNNVLGKHLILGSGIDIID